MLSRGALVPSNLPIVGAIALHISTCFGFRVRAAQGTDQLSFAGLTKVGLYKINTFLHFDNPQQRSERVIRAIHLTF
jgi:hypothetical protein